MRQFKTARSDGINDSLRLLAEGLSTSGANRTLSTEYLRELCDLNWLARRIVYDLVELALTRPPIVSRVVTGEILDQDEVWARFEDLNVNALHTDGIFERALAMGRLLGGHAILLGPEFADPTRPQQMSDGLAWMAACDLEELHVVARNNDPNSKNYGLPELYEVTGSHVRKGLRIHESRVLLCEGAIRASKEGNRLSSVISRNGFPWVSCLLPVERTLWDYDQSWESIGYLLGEASVAVFKMEGLTDMIATEDLATVTKRADMLNEGKRTSRAVFLDAGGQEEFTRTSVSFSDIPLLMQQLTTRIAGAAGEPITLLFGVSPSGLNSTGNSDLEQWYRKGAKYQTRVVRPKYERILQQMLGFPVKLKFQPLWEPSQEEKARTRLATLQGDEVLFRIGAIEPQEVVKSRTEDDTLGLRVELEGRDEIGRTAEEPDEEPEDATSEIDAQATTTPEGSGEAAS